MNFCKAEGTGNDFIIINNIIEKIPEDKLGILAKHLCMRRFSIGADGLMAVCVPQSKDADYRMLFFNADGSMGEMCGNGARCICRYGYDNGLVRGADKRFQRVETTAGIITGERITANEYRIQMNRPSKIIRNMKINLSDANECLLITKHAHSIDTNLEITCDYIELGNPGLPHVVINFSGVSAILNSLKGKASCPENEKHLHELKKLARIIRYHEAFPKGANVNIYELGEISNGVEYSNLYTHNRIHLMTYERGVEDFTYACGTGSVATALSVMAQEIIEKSEEISCDISKKEYEVCQNGGILSVTINSSDIWLKGPTNIVANGIITTNSNSIGSFLTV